MDILCASAILALGLLGVPRCLHAEESTPEATVIKGIVVNLRTLGTRGD